MLTLLLYSLLSLTSIFDLHFTDVDGNQINLSDYRGKKLLFVNTASNSPNSSQYASLETFYQKYKDSVVVISFPSNDFNNEPLSNEEIKSFIEGNYDTHFIIASKTKLIGENQDSVYHWLTHNAENGVMDVDITGDFFKILVDSDGSLIGVFDNSIDPMSNTLKDAIEGVHE